MVKLMVDDLFQVSMLEYDLLLSNISFQKEENNGSHGLNAPYLVVDGVPLDLERATKYIEEHSA